MTAETDEVKGTRRQGGKKECRRSKMPRVLGKCVVFIEKIGERVPFSEFGSFSLLWSTFFALIMAKIKKSIKKVGSRCLNSPTVFTISRA